MKPVTQPSNVTIAGVGVKATGNHQCSDFRQKFDIEQAKKLHYRIERIHFPQFEKTKRLEANYGNGKNSPEPTDTRSSSQQTRGDR